jgi:hypothetical protein
VRQTALRQLSESQSLSREHGLPFFELQEPKVVVSMKQRAPKCNFILMRNLLPMAKAQGEGL